MKRDLVIGIAGHIDHGKTALVRGLTGVDTDRLPAEKQRGISIDLGFAALDLGDVHLSLVDVPGHERFIRNMLAGATGLDLALLVVAADDSVMPQTREHLEILQFLGLSGGLIALTKADLADPPWLDLVEDDIRALVSGTFLEGAPIVRTSAKDDRGIGEVRTALESIAHAVPPRAESGLFRMAIDRVFSVHGHGTVVTGTVTSGSVAVGDELAWLPDGRKVRVRGLQRHDRPVDRVGRGARAAINVVGVHHTEVRRGQELAAPGYLEATRILSVEIRAGGHAPRPLRHRGRYRLHMGTAEVAATLSLLETNELPPGATSLAQLFLAEPAVAASGQPFVLREESPPATLGGGRVLQPVARKIRRRDREDLARFRAKDPVDRVAAALAGFRLRPWTDRDLCREAGVSIEEVAAATARLVDSGALIDLPVGPRRSVRVLKEVVSELEDRTLRAIGRLHEASPRQSAILRGRVAAELPDLGIVPVSALIGRLQQAGKVVADDWTVAVKGFEPKLSQLERRIKRGISEALDSGGFGPPDIAELADALGAKLGVVADLLALLREEERVVEITPEYFLAARAAAEIRRRVTDKLADGSTMTMAGLRDLLGTSRKYAVPIGEYLDRIGLTIREGDIRRLGLAEAVPVA